MLHGEKWGTEQARNVSSKTSWTGKLERTGRGEQEGPIHWQTPWTPTVWPNHLERLALFDSNMLVAPQGSLGTYIIWPAAERAALDSITFSTLRNVPLSLDRLRDCRLVFAEIKRFENWKEGTAEMLAAIHVWQPPRINTPRGWLPVLRQGSDWYILLQTLNVKQKSILDWGQNVCQTVPQHSRIWQWDGPKPCVTSGLGLWAL